MPPLVIDVMEAQRAALLRADEAAMRQMAQSWLQIEQRLLAQVDALALELAGQQGPLTMWQLARLRRYVTLQEQLARELSQYAAYVEGDITRRQLEAGLQAIDQSALAINAAAGDAGIQLQFDRLPVSSVERMVGLAGDGSPLRAILADASRVGPEALAQQLIEGVALGLNPREIARRAMREGLATSFTRMMTIARTEVLRVARQTTLDGYRHSRVVRAYRRVASKSTRTCVACLALDGEIYPLDRPFEEHVNGRCVLTPVLVRGEPLQYETGREWFARQPEAVQRQMMGQARWELWRDGQVTWADLVTIHESETWGRSPGVTPVRSLPGGKGVLQRGRQAAARQAAATRRAAAEKQRTQRLAAQEKLADELQLAWVNGSNSQRSVKLKHAIQRELQVDGRVWNPKARLVDAAEVEKARGPARLMYERTQEYFRAQGIKEVRLYRGIRSDVFDLNVVESWTTDLETAIGFSKGYEVREKVIPVERIFSCHQVPGWRNGDFGEQYEYLVLGSAPK